MADQNHDEPTIDPTFVKEIGEMFMQIQELLKIGLPPLEARVNHAIKYGTTDENQIDHLFSDLLDYTQIEEGLALFKRLCRYSFPLYPELTIDYIYYYRDLYDPEYASYDDEDDE
jgi:hypothetical protein